MNISIVTISFNQASYISALLLSVGQQLEDGDEHIILDPGSTDGSREIISNYAKSRSNVKCVFEPDSGPVDALRKGFAIARNEIFFYINADDLILPGSLRFAKSFFEINDYDVLVGAIKIVNQKNEMRRRGRVSDSPTKLRLMSCRVQYYQQGTYFLRSAYERCGGFNIMNRTCWDYELLIDMCLSGCSCKVIAKPLGVFRIHEKSITGSGRLNSVYRKDLARIRSKMVGVGSFFIKFFGVYFYLESKLNPIRYLSQFKGV